MGETNNNSQTEETRRHLRVYAGGKKEQRKSRMSRKTFIGCGISEPPDGYLERAKAILDAESPDMYRPRHHLMTLAEFALYARVNVRRVKGWIRQKKLTPANGLRILPDGDQRIDYLIWERRLRHIMWPALAASNTLTHHAVFGLTLHTLCYVALKARLC